MRKFLCAFFIFLIQLTQAQNFTPGNVVIYRVGNGAAATSAATAVFLDEYSPSGTLVQSLPMPVAPSGSNAALTASGTATSEGLLNRSADGFYLIATGYNALPGTAGVANTTSAATPRVVGFIDYQKNINTTTALTDYTSGNNPRSAISSDGTTVWVTGGAGGVRYTTKGSTTSTQLNSTTTNLRAVNIFNGQLYVSSASGSVRVATVGIGLPIGSGQAITNLPSFPTSTSTGPFQFQFFDLDATVPGNDVLYVADEAAGIQKYSLVAGAWVLNGIMGLAADNYRGLVATNTGSTVTIFATRKNNELVKVIDDRGYNVAPVAVAALLATAAANTAFRGVAFAPLPVPVNNLSLSFTSFTASAALQPPAVATTISDAADPLSVNGISVDVMESSTPIPATDYTLTATSSNILSVPVANIVITKSNGQATVKIMATGVGYADVILTLTKGSFSRTLTINVAASASTGTPATARFHAGSSDASAAIAIDDNYMIVCDDEMNKLFVYNRKSSGLPVTSFDYSTLLSLTDFNAGAPREVDLEASVRSISTANRIYWLGSMSNGGSSFNPRPNRNRLFAVTSSGTGSATSFNYVGMYTGLRQDLINWGDAAGYNFSASAVAGKDSKLIDGFNIEGLSFAPDNTTAYIAFRAPLVPTANRTSAVIAPIQNFEAWFNNGSPSGSPLIGAPIELNLGGRGFRDLVRLSNGTYIILAGNYDDAPSLPAIFTWNGLPAWAPVLITSFDETGLNPEGIMEVQSGGSLLLDRLQVISDNGDVVYYGDGIAAKDLSQNNFKKFRSDVLISSAGGVLPVTLKNFTVTKAASGNQLSWELTLPVECNSFMVERSINGRDFITVGNVTALVNQSQYSYNDVYNGASKIYYRIAAVEVSGKKTYSAIRIINNAGIENILLYPNPVTNGWITVATSAEGLKYIALFNAAGSKVRELSFTGSVTDLQTGNLPKGIYQLKIATKEKIITTKSIILQ